MEHISNNTTTKAKKYKYSNKPGGIKHWLDHTNITQKYICLVDPDMFLIRPIIATSIHTKQPILRINDNNHNNNNRHLLVDVPNDIQEGKPMGQHFGIGGAWATAGTSHAKPVWKHFNKSYVCGSEGACTTTSV